MTQLRKRMIEDMQLRGLAERTLEAYVYAVRQLAEYYSRSPDQITKEELDRSWSRFHSLATRWSSALGCLT